MTRPPSPARRAASAGLLLLSATGVSADSPASVAVEPVEHHGRAHYRVTTPAATWLYDAAGGGFSGLIDPAGRDWIGFRPHPLGEFPESAAAGFRGLPNLVHGGEDGGAGHPGFDLCVTEYLPPATLRTRSRSGRWAWEWTFHPDRAEFRLLQADPARAWWFLYEGNPGGEWAPGKHRWGTDPGEARPERPAIDSQLRETWRSLWFGHAASPYRLVLSHEEGETASGNLWWMGSSDHGRWATSADGMVVCGFGRGAGSAGGLLRGPHRFSVRLEPVDLARGDPGAADPSLPPLPAAWRRWAPPLDPARILRNHGQGLAYEIEDLRPAEHLPAWVRESCSVIYWRLDWAEVTDAEGRPIFEELDRRYFAGYRALGFKLAFRLMANNQSTAAVCVIPPAVIERHRIPVARLPARLAGEQICPIFWSPEFLAAHEELMEAFGRWFDGQPWASHAELGTVGEWGEMHLGRWGAATLTAHGWDETSFFRATTAAMEQMERHLPRTAKAFCWAPIFQEEPDPAYAHLLRRALRHGWWLRSDGLGEDGPAPMVRLAYDPHRDLLALIGEGGSRRMSDEAGLAAWFEANRAAGVAILNPMGRGKDFCAQFPATTRAAAARLGSRLAIAEVAARLVEPVHGRPPRLLAQITLRQDGNTPLFRPALLGLRLRGPEGVWRTHTALPATPGAALRPGDTSREGLVLELPDLPAGPSPIGLEVALLDADFGPLRLPHPGQAADGWLPVGELSSRPGPAGGDIALLFDLHRDGARAGPGIALEPVPGGWRFTGEPARAEAVLGAPHTLPTAPGLLYLSHARYRLALQEPAHGGFFHWLNLRGEAGALTTFLASPAYDGAGQWQEGVIRHRPRPNDRVLEPMFLAKGVGRLSGEISDWTLEAVRFPDPADPAVAPVPAPVSPPPPAP